MKKLVLEFLHRGLLAFGFGPLVMALVYLILHHCGIVDEVSVKELCLGVFTSAALAFVVGGANVVYQIERIPSVMAIYIHGGILYISYLTVYLTNGWLKHGKTPFVMFTVIFVVGYGLIWLIIYWCMKRRTDRLNRILEERKR